MKIAVLGPLMVVLLQGRITAWSLSWSRRARILIAAGLTGLPFLLLIVAGDGLTVAVVLVLSVVGEMLWVPTAQGIAADMAPATRRGAYLGAFGGATSLSYAVAPLVALELRGQAGNDAMWILFAVVAVIGAIAGVPPSAVAHLVDPPKSLGGNDIGLPRCSRIRRVNASDDHLRGPRSRLGRVVSISC